VAEIIPLEPDPDNTGGGKIMKKLLLAGLLLAPCFLAAQQVTTLDSIVIYATQTAKDSPVAHSKIDRQALDRVTPMQNLPFALTLTPGVVAVGENGTGSGYAYLRIRGSEGSRIQVNLNGITLNDAESQEVFWVNMPSVGDFLQSVQVQRGIGTSVNGPGAFGATVNMQTLHNNPGPYGTADLSYGSFNSWNISAGAGTGLGTDASFLSRGLGFDIRYAHGRTDGYIRNGKGNLHSLFSRLSFIRPDYSFKLYYIYGEQHTGITWEGISREDLEKDRRYNPAGEYTDDQGNIRYYPNETDNYTQHHVQLNYAHKFGSAFSWSHTLHFTKGDGYYENYKEKGDNDYIVRRSMDNAYFVWSGVGHFMPGAGRGHTPFTADLGLNWAGYFGKHFGLRTNPVTDPDFAAATEYYRNTGNKYDMSTYLKLNYRLGLGHNTDNALRFFADLQYRRVNVIMEGPDNDGALLNYTKVWNFFNPKGGVTFIFNKDHQVYASVSAGHREPSRSDIKESIKAGRAGLLKSEQMTDYETGYRFSARTFSLGVNLYAMEYKNQLVPTGKKSDTGYEIKENVPVSYRRGIETEAGWQPTQWLQVEGNLCLSTNKIKDVTIYLDTYDHPDNWNPVEEQMSEYYELTDIVYSPSYTAAARVAVRPFARRAGFPGGLELALTGRFVGRQYYDNTSNPDRSLPAYQVLGFNASQTFPTRRCGIFRLDLFADNLLNRKYCASVWAYRAAFRDTGTVELSEGFYPQAGINFMIKLSWRWGN